MRASARKTAAQKPQPAARAVPPERWVLTSPSTKEQRVLIAARLWFEARALASMYVHREWPEHVGGIDVAPFAGNGHAPRVVVLLSRGCDGEVIVDRLELPVGLLPEAP
jgi:hypothetical protein